MKRYRLGVDVGGTFTDIILINSEGQIFYTKTPSTPQNQSKGVLDGIKKVIEFNKVRPDEIDQIVHGTTVATNALLERKGSRTALLTTKGFKDVIYIGRQNRSQLYSLAPQKPAPLIPRNLIIEITERMLYTGEVFSPLDEEEVIHYLHKLNTQQIEAIAVCFLHSYANPKHEERVKALAKKECPNMYVCISSELLREFREYERMNATVINAYVTKIMHKYISSIVEGLSKLGIKPVLSIMQSNGGFMSEERARDRGLFTLLSGPAAGVLGAAFVGQLCGYNHVISVDMGGTSFDVSLIEKGEARLVNECNIGGFPLKIPIIDIHTIGAGGGSIAWVDAGGILQVGPQSAGADPGPVCYGKGGTEPTVTDANLLLGRIDPDYFLGGGMKLDVEAARKAIIEKIADPLGISTEKACEGILTVVNARMARGIRVVSIERGHDIRQFTLFAFGGAGPLHACTLARMLKIPRVLIPVAPGNFSTFGLLTGDVRYNYVRTYVTNEELIDYRTINNMFTEMEVEAFSRITKEGFSENDVVLLRHLDLRYFGQAYELTVPIEQGKVDTKKFLRAKQRFHEAHKKAYGFSRPDELVEVVNLRVTCIGKIPLVSLQKTDVTEENPDAALKGTRQVYFDGQWLETMIFSREELQPGNRIMGPAIIEEMGSTILIYPGDIGCVDEYGNIIIQICQ